MLAVEKIIPKTSKKFIKFEDVKDQTTEEYFNRQPI